MNRSIFLFSVLLLMFLVTFSGTEYVYSQTSGIATASVAPDQNSVSSLNKCFEPLQENPQYYGDRRFRKLLPPHKVNKLKSYNANFGKKIWVKAWTIKDFKSKKKLFGKLLSTRKLKITAVEASDELTPYMRNALKNSNIDFEKWTERIEEFARSYVNPGNAGKIPCDIKVYDYQNGNIVVIKATLLHNKKMVYFVGEGKDDVIKALLKYKI